MTTLQKSFAGVSCALVLLWGLPSSDAGAWILGPNRPEVQQQEVQKRSWQQGPKVILYQTQSVEKDGAEAHRDIGSEDSLSQRPLSPKSPIEANFLPLIETLEHPDRSGGANAKSEDVRLKRDYSAPNHDQMGQTHDMIRDRMDRDAVDQELEIEETPETKDKPEKMVPESDDPQQNSLRDSGRQEILLALAADADGGDEGGILDAGGASENPSERMDSGMDMQNSQENDSMMRMQDDQELMMHLQQEQEAEQRAAEEEEAGQHGAFGHDHEKMMQDMQENTTEKKSSEKTIGVEERLGETATTKLEFVDSSGKTVSLDELLTAPTILLPVYYTCPSACNMILSSFASVLSKVKLDPGKEYRVIALSFDGNDTPRLAAQKKHNFYAAIGKEFPADAWVFLTGKEENSRKVLDSLGYHYERRGNAFVHPSVVVALSEDGKIIRYLYGTSFMPFDVTMAATEAAEGRTGVSIKRLVAFCFDYDPEGKRYVFSTMRVAGFAVLLGAGILLVSLLVAGRRKKKD